MFTVQDFVAKYKNYTDEELYGLNSTISDYSDEAREALEIVLQKKGGLETIVKALQSKKIITDEIRRITKETIELGGKGTNVEFLKTLIKSNILPEEQVHTIIDLKFAEIEAAEKDRRITPKTILGSVIGSVIASVIGGILWGLQLIYSHRIFFILGLGLILLCYGIIKLTTRQSKENTAVFIATLIAVLLSLAIGGLLYKSIGYRG